MKSFYVERDLGKLHYLQVGTGERVMLCFPGFGQSAHTFSRLLSYRVKENYTFFIIDMFYEGKSELYKEVILSQQSWEAFIGVIIRRHEIKKYTLLAYSIGARMALCLSGFDKMILIAPDGIKNRGVFKVIAYNKWVGNLLTRLSLKLNGVTKLNSVLRKWTNPKFVYKIAKIWRCLSKLPNLHPTVPTTVYIGTKDIVAHNKEIAKWANQLEQRELKVCKKGHFSLLVFVLRREI